MHDVCVEWLGRCALEHGLRHNVRICDTHGTAPAPKPTANAHENALDREQWEQRLPNRLPADKNDKNTFSLLSSPAQNETP